MPAYRSPAEAEIRDAVVARIRERRPAARIIHEINVSSFGPNRMDLIAVDREEIIAFEIKSSIDKLDRLPAQIRAMRDVAHHVVVALHEKHLVETKTNSYAAHCERAGEFYRRDIPEGLPRSGCYFWVYPEIRRNMPGAEHDPLARWRFPEMANESSLPHAGIDLLWRNELYELCGRLRIAAGPRSTMVPMTRALRWHCTGKELTRGICAILRARRCVEADPEIGEADAEFRRTAAQ